MRSCGCDWSIQDACICNWVQRNIHCYRSGKCTRDYSVAVWQRAPSLSRTSSFVYKIKSFFLDTSILEITNLYDINEWFSGSPDRCFDYNKYAVQDPGMKVVVTKCSVARMRWCIASTLARQIESYFRVYPRLWEWASELLESSWRGASHHQALTASIIWVV